MKSASLADDPSSGASGAATSLFLNGHVLSVHPS